MSSPQNLPQTSGTRDPELAELIGRVAGGDEGALTTLYETTSRLVYGLALRILRDAGAAEEVLLDVYTQVWRKAGAYQKGRGTPLSWLTTIARSRAIDRLRAGRYERQRSEQLESETQGAHAATIHVGDEMQAHETRASVRSALGELPPEQREVIELAYYGGMSHSEIAARLGQPLGTVKTRTRLGMMRLRELLRPAYEGTL
ncbi:MAG TPA: sigma-70 family RNA polymerase sigma factor [Pyrinomonadaceae bacterium]|jgi:RNA polymerase sigma-70 factor (ECF subfamily)|nr:sigma-70 family RNA polymerase sigma factor [Pyrinomonadaceae bacterium]